MQMKDVMLFQAKINVRQNQQLLEMLAKVSSEMLTQEFPLWHRGPL